MTTDCLLQRNMSLFRVIILDPLFACRVSVRLVGWQEGGGNEPGGLLRLYSLYQEAIGAGDFQGENLEELC
jgi:hypothetical protein